MSRGEPTCSAPKVVIPAPFTATLGLRRAAQGSRLLRVVAPPGPRTAGRAEEIAAQFADADVILASPEPAVRRRGAQGRARLRMVSSPVVGFDHIDVDTATELGILVSNCPTDEIIVGMAEATVMFMVALSLQLERKQATMRGWRAGAPPTTSTLLRRKTVGLIGYGRIGAGGGAAAPGLGGHHPGRTIRTSRTRSRWTILLRRPRTSSRSTRRARRRRVGLIGARELALMKPTAILINTARGGVIDEAALAEAIDDGQISAAALDAW